MTWESTKLILDNPKLGADDRVEDIHLARECGLI
jgi:hypothetical protein